MVARPCVRLILEKDVKLRNDSLRTYRRATYVPTKQYTVKHWLLKNNFEVFDSDISTFEVAVAKRVLQEVPSPQMDHILWKKAKKFLKKLLRKLKSPLLTLQKVREYILKNYTGKKRERYLNALDSLLLDDLDASEAKVNGFTKRQNEDFSDGVKDPRAIQYRCDRWLVFFFVLKSMEHEIYHSRGLINKFDSEYEVCKCLTPKQKAMALYGKVKQLRNPAIIQWDGKRWDAHVNSAALRMEHSFYVNFVKYRGGDWKRFEKLLECQVHNAVSARCRDGYLKYKVEGNRMSGDWNTSIGNVLLMLAFVVSSLEYLGIKEEEWRILDDGDDCLLVIEEDKASLVYEKLRDCFLVFGQELKVDEPIAWRDYHKVEFCQSKLIQTSPGEYTFVRSFAKALDSYFNSYKWFRESKSTNMFLCAIGLGDANLYYGVPVLWELAYAAYRMGGELAVSNEEVRELGLYRFKDVDYGYDCLKRPEVTTQARSEFERAFGLSFSEQLNLEADIRNHLHW